MKIVVATDAWGQTNGVVFAYQRIAEPIREFGAELAFVTPDGFRSAPLPTYPGIRLAFATPREVGRRIDALAASHVHIATEGPIGWAARRYCINRGIAFTTSYHTRFPEYVAARLPVPLSWSYAYLRRFHAPAERIFVPTLSMQQELERRGFANVVLWTRGVDHGLFRPREFSTLDLPRPIFLNVGRVAVEKNLEAFLNLDLPGSKVVVGDGPARRALQNAYPQAHFLGEKFGAELAEVFASADAFVFPSRTDTFGVVLIEALASGLPVAAYPVTGPLDVIADSGAGALDEDLRRACLAALDISRERARARSLVFTWRESARQFVEHVGDVRVPALA
ncbi:MAG: glycosyltransferase family 1 protein [Pseudomonadota bacterium]|nr:glycosyltransferase family 1 protein [Pseudomonadota bacterium]